MVHELATILGEPVGTVVVSVFSSAALVWVSRAWIAERLKGSIKHEYDAKLESHKTQLKASLDTELERHRSRLAIESASATERLKSELQIAAAEHQIRFSHLHEKVAEVVAETYARLSRLTAALQRYVSIIESNDGPTKYERRMAVAKAMTEFRDYFLPRRLYLPKGIAEQIAQLDGTIHAQTHLFMFEVEIAQEPNHDMVKAWARIASEVQSEIQPLLAALEDKFRGLLGVPVGD